VRFSRIRFLGCTSLSSGPSQLPVSRPSCLVPAVRFARVYPILHVRHEFPLRAACFRRVLRHVAGFPDLRLLCPIRHLVGMRRSPACLHAPCLTIPPAPTPCQGSSPVRVPTLSVSWFHLIQEPSGLPEFSDASLPACHGLMTPADIHALALDARFMLASRSLTLSPSAGYVSRSCPDLNRRTSGSAISPTAYRILCVRLPCKFVRGLRTKLRSRTNTRYGWVASPYPTGTFTRQETPSFARRDNDNDDRAPRRRRPRAAAKGTARVRPTSDAPPESRRAASTTVPPPRTR
jgi:hypothetical protein